MKQISLLMLCFLLSLSTGWAQDKIKFNETTHDFGQIDEKGGNAVCEFVLTNNSDAPLVISQVSASCGCTTPSWTKEPIAPGKTGIVMATYVPLGRPGPFSKTITVYTSAGQTPSILSIKGEVVQGKRSPEEEYPIAFGALRMKNNNLNIGQIVVTEPRVITIEVFNNGKAPLSLKFDKLPKYMTVSYEPATIPAGTAAKMTVTINAPLAKKYGPIKDSFQVIVGNDLKTAPANVFTINAVLIDDVNKLNTVNAAKMTVTTNQINFGKLSDSGAKTSQILKISNSGKSDLTLHSIGCDNHTFALSKSKAIIKPGEIFELKVDLTKKITGPQRGNLTITSNDPTSPQKEILVIANP